MNYLTVNDMAIAIIGYIQKYCNALLAVMSESNRDSLNVSRTALHRWWQVHTANTILIHSLKIAIWARISFKIMPLFHKVTTSYHPPCLAFLMDNYRPTSTFHSYSMTLIEASLRRVLLAAAVFHYNTAKTWNDMPLTVRSMETLGSFKSLLWKQLLELSFCI